PIIAGLNGFCHRPPYNCLAMITANTVPSTTIHHGARGGILTASNKPVSNAELSFNVAATDCLRSLSTRASANRALTDAKRICTRVRQTENHSCDASTDR